MDPEYTSRQYVKVAFELKIGKKLEYEVPEDLRPRIHPGCKIWAPLGRRKQVGYIVDFIDKPSFSPVKEIIGLVESKLKVPDNIMRLARWMADYYCADSGMTLTSIVPAAVRKNTAKFRYISIVTRAVTKEEMRNKCRDLQAKSRRQAEVLAHMLKVEGGIVLKDLCDTLGATVPTINKLVDAGMLKIEKHRHTRDIFDGEAFLSTEPKKLTEDQQRAFDLIFRDVEKGEHAVHLICGVTSSGKTEVYLHLMRRILDAGKSAIMLVPEISLTPQTIERIRSRFGDVISVMHHRLSDGERHDEWHKLLEGKSRIAIGARSAVFAPVQDLGLIVVDEEHEKSYKQTDTEPTYNARDIAVVRAKMENAVVVLGSATPSMESYYNAIRGKYILSELPSRIDDMPMPLMKVVDMTRNNKGGSQTILSDEMITAIEKRIENGEQVMLFLNRRGYATTLICRGCGEVMMCEHCSIPMKFHKGENRLICHMCGYTRAAPKTCPSCRNETVLHRGFGTEKVEKLLYARFPKATVLRMDFDTTRKKHSHNEILKEFKSGRAEILVGTQMIAKGLHFPNVTLVGIISADTSLYMQDFRASENTYQLITQVSGRAGRGDIAGEVIIQTSMPNHYSIKAACHNLYREFFEREIESRKVLRYPPLLRMVVVTIRGKKEEQVKQAAKEIVTEAAGIDHKGIDILGPTEAPIKRTKGDYRWQIFLKSTRVSAMTHLISNVLEKIKLPSGLKVLKDVDPVEML